MNFFSRKPNIFDNMMAMMEKYANNLEALVDERTDQLTEEKKKTGLRLKHLSRIVFIILKPKPFSIFRRPAVRNVAALRGGAIETGAQSGGGKLRQRHDLFQRYRRIHRHVRRKHTSTGDSSSNSSKGYDTFTV